jgi:hypothetical protein
MLSSTVVLLLKRPDLAGDITRNETYNLQNLYGGLEPVLETRYEDGEVGWAGDWIGRVWLCLSVNDIFIHVIHMGGLVWTWRV